MRAVDDFQEAQEETGFQVTDDQSALWCINKIKQTKREADALLRHYEAQAAKVRKESEERTAFFSSLLEPYFDTLPKHTTTTQESYPLPGATLVRKAQAPTFTRDADKLLAFLKASGRTECIKTVESPSWSDYKPLTQITQGENGPQLVDKETGEIVDGVTVTENPPKFEVKIDAI
jgi:hypothetical protein